ncbi:MAG TPA: RodZ domain-containing protein [Candidatus Acidoferrales bacterium]|jgi:cytoskeletal protein RodZ|nr:RodZ domain-containing protein [Candidatus Acidoferrales bacterium]
MPSKPFGEHLKREREMRGVTLEEISVATRIAPRFLAALESEQWELLPGGVFNRGFIRSVARYLGLDEDSLVAEYALETRGRSDPGVVADPPQEPDRNWARVFAVVVLVLAVLAGGWAAIHFLGPKIAARLHKHSGEPVNSAPDNGATPSFAANSAPAAGSPDTGTATPSDPAISASPSAGGGDASTSGTTPTLDLKLEAAQAADVKVVADGKPVFEGHMGARQVYRFTAMDSLEVSSSESSAIVLELNGQAVAAGVQPGQPGSVTLTQKDLKPAAGDSH